MLTGTLRAYDMRRDLDGFYDLAEAAYVEDFARIGRDARAGIERERRVVGLVSLVARIFPPLRDLSPGFIWEEEGRIVSCVHFARAGMAGDQWSIETVATHPDHQRRGLARCLVRQAIESIRQRGGSVCTLKVRADNAPAYELYRGLGFAHYDTTVHMKLAERRGTGPTKAVGYEVRSANHSEWYRLWEERYDLGLRDTPPDVQAMVPVPVHRYRRRRVVRWLAPVIIRLSGHRATRLMVDHEGLLVATLSVSGDLSGERTHEFEVHIDPRHEHALAPLLVERALKALQPLPPANVLTEVRPSSAGFLSALRDHGFAELSTWHWLALRVGS